MLSQLVLSGSPLLAWFWEDLTWTQWLLGFFVLLPLVYEGLGLRYIPNNYVGVVEKLWSRTGSVPEGRIIALAGEAGYQADLLRGGFHFGMWRWQYRIHRVPLVTVPQGKIGYIYARDGEPLAPSQTLGRIVPCNNFQDAEGFLEPTAATNCMASAVANAAILREGVYAINTALFVVITEDAVYRLNKILGAARGSHPRPMAGRALRIERFRSRHHRRRHRNSRFIEP